MRKAGVEFTFRKIEYLEKRRGMPFAIGLQKYFEKDDDEREEYYPYFMLFEELTIKAGHSKNVLSAQV